MTPQRSRNERMMYIWAGVAGVVAVLSVVCLVLAQILH